MTMSVKTYVCRETQDSITMYDYTPSQQPSMYKAKRNGLPVVVQIIPSELDPNLEMTDMRLCPGIVENVDTEALMDYLAHITIVRTGQEVTYRSKDCLYLYKGQFEKCQHCFALMTNLKISQDNKKEEEELKVEPDFGDYDFGGDNGVDDDYDDNGHYGPVIEIKKRKKTRIKTNSEEETDVKLFMCSECGAKLKSEGSLKKHKTRAHGINEDKNYKCPEPGCGRTFFNYGTIVSHAKKVHGLEEDVLNMTPQKSKAKYLKDEKCPLCDEMFFPQSATILNHMTTVHVTEKENPIYIEFLKERMKSLVCSECGETFLTEHSMSKHIRNRHPDIVASSYTESCDVCGKVFKSKAVLKHHMLGHEEKDCLCNKCGASFKNKLRLRHHLNTIHGEKPICNECGKICRNKTALKKHVQMFHLGIREHQCNSCDKFFTSRNKLNTHILSVHDKVKPFACEQCGFASSRSDNLNLHRRKTHQLPGISKTEYKNLVESGTHPYVDKVDPEMFSMLK